MGQQSMVGLLLKGRRLWRKGSLVSRQDLSPQFCMCCSFHSTHQSRQHADVAQLNNMASPSGFFNVGQCSSKNTSMDYFIRSHHGDFSCYSKLFNTTTFEPAATSSSDVSSGKTLSKISVFGAISSLEHSSSFVSSISQIRTCSRLWPQRRRDPLWIGRRTFFSAETYKSVSNHKSGSQESPASRLAATDETEAETNASSSESDEDFDFRNFPALTSSFYEGYERPIEMQPKKSMALQSSRKLFNTDSKLTLESIPQPKGRTYDFGLGDMFSKPPPLEAGARPQGRFDIDISLDECEKAPSERSILPQRMPNHTLSWDTPEADFLSEISADSQDSVSKHGQEADNWAHPQDGVMKHEQEFYWDPYD